MEGWIKLFRRLSCSPMWMNTTPHQKTIFMTLLLTATHEPHKTFFCGREILLKPGQVSTSIQGLCKLSGPLITEQNVRTALKKFKNMNFLTCESTKQGTLVTIVNWDKYQGKNTTPNTPVNTDLTHDQHTSNNVSHNNTRMDIQECKECKECKEVVEGPNPFLVYQNCIGQVNPVIAKDISAWMELVDAELICKVLEITAANNARWPYAKAILERCRANNIKIVADLEADAKRFKAKSKGTTQSKKYQQRSYTDEFLESLYERME